MDEERTIKLVKELADTLESVAVGPLHTPRLYSTFLKAVIASKTGGTVNGEKESFENGEQSEPPTSPSIHTSPSISIQSPLLQQPPQQHAGTQIGMISPNPSPGELAPSVHAPANGVFPYDYYPFQNDGEMGTVVDISTFPPTMAEQDHSWPQLSVDNIFSTNFWDNVLVPGMSSLDRNSIVVICRLRACDILRYFGLSGRSLWWLRVWSRCQRVDHPWIRDVSHSIRAKHPTPRRHPSSSRSDDAIARSSPDGSRPEAARRPMLKSIRSNVETLVNVPLCPSSLIYVVGFDPAVSQDLDRMDVGFVWYAKLSDG